MPKPFQTLTVRDFDDHDPCVVWVNERPREQLVPVYRHREPWGYRVRVGDKLDFYAQGPIVHRVTLSPPRRAGRIYSPRCAA